jgi:hypothetical protein
MSSYDLALWTMLCVFPNVFIFILLQFLCLISFLTTVTVCENDASKLYQALLEANMATEVGLIALDALGLYCVHFKDNLLAAEGDNIVMRKVFDIYLSFLQVGQSETLFRHVFAALRAYINNFSVALFQG